MCPTTQEQDLDDNVMTFRGEIQLGEEHQASTIPQCYYKYEPFKYTEQSVNKKSKEHSILVKTNISANNSEPETLCLWNPTKLDRYTVQDYLHVARKYFSKNLRHQEDIMLMWLVRNNYDVK